MKNEEAMKQALYAKMREDLEGFAQDLHLAQDGEKRYLENGDLTALSSSVAACDRVLQSPILPTIEENAELRIKIINIVAEVLLLSFRARGHISDLRAGIELLRQTISTSPEGTLGLSNTLSNLGHGLYLSFGVTGHTEELYEAIGINRRIVATTSANSPDLPIHLHNLGNSLRISFLQAGHPAELEEAINLFRQAIKVTPTSASRFPLYLNSLGASLSARYKRNGRADDLEEAICIFQEAVGLTPADSPDLPMYLSNLAVGLRDRYQRTGGLEDLEEAIVISQQAVELTPPDSPDRTSRLSNLGNGLRDRHEITGCLEDIEEAIQTLEQVVTLASPDSPDRPIYLSNLGNGLRDRYTRTGRLEDLEEAIRVFQQAASLNPSDSFDQPAYFTNLGNGLCDRYIRTGRLEDIQEAIRVFQQAATLASPDSPDRPMYLSNLGNGLRHRYVRTGRLEHLEEAIRVYQQAVILAPSDSSDLSLYLNNLGVGLRERYARIGRLEDIEEAIHAFQKAVNLTPSDSYYRPSRINNLGTGLRVRFERTGHLEDLEEAIRYYRWACGLGAIVAPQETLNAARNWGRWALRRASWLEVEEAYSQGLAAGRALQRRQLRRSDRESYLAEMQEMAPAAAYAIARAGGSPVRAAHILELGRAQLLGEALQLNRRDLDSLPAELKAAFDRALAERRRLEQPDATVQGSRLAAIEAADRAFESAVAAIRQVDGFADFLADPTFNQILAAAHSGPLVYLLATEAGGLALVVHGESASNHLPGSFGASGKVRDNVEALWLDDLRRADVDAILYDVAGEAEGRYLRGAAGGDHAALARSLAVALPLLGERLMRPLAAHLAAAYPQGTPVTLITSSNLGLLPLHAAPVTLDSRTAPFLDFFAVRYAPSATALLHATGKSAQAAGLHVAGVGNPLPSLETGDWAQQQVAALLPRLQAIDVDRHLLPLPDDLPAAERAAAVDRRDDLLKRWQRTLGRLAAMATMKRDDLVRTGRHYVDLIRLLPLLDAVEWPPLLMPLLELAQRLPPSLDAAEAEAYSVRDLAGPQRSDLLFTHAATASALWARLRGATWLHLACHGRFDVSEPLDSALLLAEGTQISLRDLLAPQAAAALAAIRLAFLSACQTAITDFRSLGDEVIGLPAGFLQAGIPAVVGTLWPVDDRSTALLVTRFYELLLLGDAGAGLAPQRPIHALRLAQQWLRTIDNAALADYLDRHQQLMAAPAGESDRMSWLLIRDERRRVREAIEQGRDRERPYDAPYHWAPFAYFGADLDPVG